MKGPGDVVLWQGTFLVYIRLWNGLGSCGGNTAIPATLSARQKTELKASLGTLVKSYIFKKGVGLEKWLRG